MRKALIDLLTLHEGFSSKPYRCTSGKLTIGIGRNIEEVGITHQEALVLLNNDIDRCIFELKNALPWFDDLNEVRQVVLIDMCFNLGLKRLLGFRNALHAMTEKDWQRASDEMLDSKWAGQVGSRAKRLAEMMLKGV